MLSPGLATCAPESCRESGAPSSPPGAPITLCLTRLADGPRHVVPVHPPRLGRRGVPDAQGESERAQRHDDGRPQEPAARAPRATATATANGTHSSITFRVIT